MCIFPVNINIPWNNYQQKKNAISYSHVFSSDKSEVGVQNVASLKIGNYKSHDIMYSAHLESSSLFVDFTHIAYSPSNVIKASVTW
jgi:hypothetical protein